ncbi:unnamed protein product [Cladocopium goreaui]|uniref:N-acetyltransferase domain-containing protein n=1 Tax=Cladocopium goreaui TaxID=2562237 RepID=A0A9P1D283_9DINO|nr:unnamed protein product [Cladocopium goreaui]
MLRPALPADGLDIAKVYLATWNSHQGDLTRTEASNGSNAKDKDFHCQEVLRQQAERFTNFVSTGNRLFIVAEAERQNADRQLCAFISYGRSYTREGFGEVMQLFVHPDFQRKGLGSKLLREAWTQMKSRDWSAQGCHVWCTKGNPANRVYEQVGWFRTGKQKSLNPTLSKEPVEVEEYLAPKETRLLDLLRVKLSSCCGWM